MTYLLPWRGLGLSSNLNAADEPHPYRLREAEPGLFDFVEYSAPLSLAEARAQASLFVELDARRAEMPVLFHPVHLNLYGPELESAEALGHLAEHAAYVGSAWVGNDVGWWHRGGEPFPGYLYLPPPLTEAGVADCAVHGLHVQAALPVPLLLENPAVVARRGDLHVLDFMGRLHARTGLPLLLDLGHLFAHQLSRGLSLAAGLDGFPLEQVVEIHLAGGLVTRRGERRFYADDHTQPVREELFEMLERVLPRCERLRAVTFEGDGHPREIAAVTLRRLRPLVPRERPGEVRVEPAAAIPGATLSTRPWELFEEAYTEDGVREDPEGSRAELDLRLAVLAQLLDTQWPATRLLVAGTREALMEFSASEEFRGAFGEGGGGVGKAFGAWARRAVRARRDDAAAAALAFETWAHGAHSHAPSPAPGRAGLASGVAVRAFPFDLSELLFAVKAVRRHLLGQAWATGQVEASGLESLRQVALRPQAGPWRVAIRRTAGRLEVYRLSPTLEGALRAAEEGRAWEAFLGGGEGHSGEAARQLAAEGWVTRG